MLHHYARGRCDDRNESNDMDFSFMEDFCVPSTHVLVDEEETMPHVDTIEGYIIAIEEA